MKYFKFLRGSKEKGNNERINFALPSYLWDSIKFILNDLYVQEGTRPTRLYVFENDYVELIRTWINHNDFCLHSHIQVRYCGDLYNFYYKESLHINYVMYMYEIN